MPTDFDPALPLERASTIPSDWYIDPARHRFERDTVFAPSWQCVARAEQLREPGQFVAFEFAGEPILLVRGTDGVLRSFFNVCRHRAAPIANEPEGCAAKLRCRYHGWTYDLAGRLIGLPEFAGVCDFEREDNGLVPAGVVQECGPFVWWKLNRDETKVDSTFAPFFSSIDFDGLVWKARRSYDLACNWKVAVDNYLDGGYHIQSVHPALAGAIDYAAYRTETFAHCSVQSAPLVTAPGDVGSTRRGAAAYWWLWPNFMVNRSAGVMDTNWVQPLAHDRCRVIFDFYFDAGTAPEFIEQSIRVAEQVQQEDVTICEEVQRGLGSRSYRTGRYSVKRENGGHHFHRLLAESGRAVSSSSTG